MDSITRGPRGEIGLITENSFNSKVFHSYKIRSIDTDTDYYG